MHLTTLKRPMFKIFYFHVFTYVKVSPQQECQVACTLVPLEFYLPTYWEWCLLWLMNIKNHVQNFQCFLIFTI